jgi:N-acetylglucosaminyldiphosphoundecaprenol N-acetyl-beta-D-mannosaminyltransferase
MPATFSDPQPISAPRTRTVLGSPLAVTDYARAAALVLDWARRRDVARAVEAANTHVVTLSRHEPEFRAAMEKFDLLLPDGMPLVWLMNRGADERLDDRVYGPTYMLRVIEAAGADFSHFLLGGTDELLGALQKNLAEKFPAIRIAGVYSPPFGEWPAGEDERIIARIAESGASLVWIGLGCSRQEFWVARNKARLPPAVYSTVGAAFAFHAGRVSQAPAWMQDRGLEWLYRLLAEPRRLWRRYLFFNSLFVFYLVKDAIARRR